MPDLRTCDHQNPAKAASQPSQAPPGANASALTKRTRERGSFFSRAISRTASLMSQALTCAAVLAMYCVQ